MKWVVIALGSALALGSAWAQTVTPAPKIGAAVCAYNTIAPSPVAGSFYLIQCDFNGKIIVK